MTSIESRALWGIHRQVFDAARAAGACWGCATQLAFAATDRDGEKTEAKLHPRCEAAAKTKGRAA